ncbi:hypothetical protein D9M68_784390 [compost metagenome]
MIRRQCRIHQNVPAMPGNRGWDHHEGTLGQQVIAELLLAKTGGSRNQPVRVGYLGRINPVDQAGIEDACDRQGMRHAVQRTELLVHGNFQDRSGGVRAGIHCLDPLGVPPPATQLSADPAIPRGGMIRQIKLPEMDVLSPWMTDQW